MLARRKRNLGSRHVVGLLVAVAVSMLPKCLLWLAIGAAIVVATIKLFAARRAEGVAVVLIGIGIAGWMIYRSSARIARTRSALVLTVRHAFRLRRT